MKRVIIYCDGVVLWMLINVDIIGELYSYNEVGMMLYGLKVDGKDILVGFVYELSENILRCLDDNLKVHL